MYLREYPTLRCCTVWELEILKEFSRKKGEMGDKINHETK